MATINKDFIKGALNRDIQQRNQAQQNMPKPQVESELQQKYDSTWGTNRIPVLSVNIEDIVDFTGKRGRKQPFKLDKKRVEVIAQSIKDIGLATPLIVRKYKDNKYQILSGHHRFHACKDLGWKQIPCRIVEVSDEDAERYVIECNIQRQKIAISEYSEIIVRYLDYKKDLGLTMDDISKKFGITRQQLSHYRNVYLLHPDLQEQIDFGRIYLETVDLWIKLTPEQQIKFAELVKDNPKKVVVNVGKRIADMFADYPLDEITPELYADCFSVQNKTRYKNKVYNNVWNKYPNIPVEKRISEEDLDKMVEDYLDDYITKNYEQAKAVEQTKTEEESEDLER